MTHYRHLNQTERYQIEALVTAGVPTKTIASQLARHIDTIKRELTRGSQPDGAYCAELAHALSQKRKTGSRNARRVDQACWTLVWKHLDLGLSPQQVAQRLKEQNMARVSHECIDQKLYASAQLPAQLRCQRKKRRARATAKRSNSRRGAIRDRVGIEQRAAIVEQKTRIGDWDGDTVVGKRHLGGLVTLVDRVSRYTLVGLVQRRCAHTVESAIVQMLTPHQERCHTITLDNGSEFANHLAFAKALQTSVYFAKPHHPWQRGLNENTNGLLRHYFPKGTNLQKVTTEQVQHAAERLNHRPRKCLGWRTPHEVFYDLPMTALTL
jgi:IS30 family transposase